MLLGKSVALGQTSAGQRGFDACAVKSEENARTVTETVKSRKSAVASMHTNMFE